MMTRQHGNSRRDTAAARAISTARSGRFGRRSAGRVTRAARRAPAPCSASYAFTIVELLVVIGLIVLILGFGLPAFNAMVVQQRQNKTLQLLNSTLVHMHVISLSDQTFTAVRLLPTEWQFDPQRVRSEALGGRQVITTYAYRQVTMPDPDQPTRIRFEERFEPLEGGPMHVLPYDTWIAPLEALDTTRYVPDRPAPPAYSIGNHVLSGTIGQFERNANSRENNNETLLDADDFLFVFDPRTGLFPSLNRQPWLLVGYDPSPDALREWAGVRYSGGDLIARQKYQRFNFTGAVIYAREPFVAAGKIGDNTDQIQLRRDILRRHGMNYYVEPRGGSLIAGSAEER